MTSWGAHWMHPHLAAICFESIGVALRKTGVDLSVIFYDVTAFVAQGRYAESKLIDFGFAHNTQQQTQTQAGLGRDCRWQRSRTLPQWSGRTSDQATVEENLKKLAEWLRKHGRPLQDTLVVGDRAMRSTELTPKSRCRPPPISW